MTRDPLRPLEGQLVWLTGRPTNTRAVDGSRDICLASPKVWPWDGQGPIRQGKPIRVGDHAWLRVEAGTPVHLLAPGAALARVGWYRRRDQTVDLGLAPLKHLLLEQMEPAVVEAYREGRLEELDAQLTQAADWIGQGSPLVSLRLPTAEARRHMERWREEVRRDLEAQRRIGPSGACRGHRPQGLALPLRTARNGTGRGARQGQRAGFG